MPSKVLSGLYGPCKGDIYYSSMRDELIVVISQTTRHGYFTCLSLKSQTKLVAELSMSRKMGWHIWLSVEDNPLD